MTIPGSTLNIPRPQLRVRAISCGAILTIGSTLSAKSRIRTESRVDRQLGTKLKLVRSSEILQIPRRRFSASVNIRLVNPFNLWSEF